MVLWTLAGFVATAPVAVAQDGPAGDGSDAQTAQQAMQGGGMTSDRELDDDRAREHFQIAQRYYDEGRFVEAARQFEEAYELSGRSELQYNAYIAYREAHQRRRAEAMLAAYLEQVPDAPDRVNLEARLVELRRAIQQEEEQAEQLTEAEQRADSESRRAQEEARARREAEAAPEAWPWVILGVGGAAAVAGAVVGGLALAEVSALQSACMDEVCQPSVNLDGRRTDARTMALVGDFLLFGGGAVALTGLILGVTFGLGSDPDEVPAVSAACDPRGCYATIGGTF